MIKSIISGVLFSILLLSCGEPVEPITQLQASPDSVQFYATTKFFKDQVDYISILKKPIYLYHTVNNKTDSILIDSLQFSSLTNEFITKDISSPEIKRNYKETVFQDASTSSYNLNYTTVNPNVIVQGVDILLDEETNQVKRIFIRSKLTKGDTTIQEKHNWHAFKGFQISRSLTTPNGYQSTEITEVRWETIAAKE